VIDLITVLLSVSITDTVPLPLFTTYTLLPSGLAATPMGLLPTLIVAITLLFAVSITETVFERLFAI
jgi:hypothetical protein